MIGLVVRSVVGDSLGACGAIIGPIIAIAAICGLMQLCQCRMRDCGCCKRLLRATGADPFDDFEIMVLVHKVTFTASSKQKVYLRVKAGEHEVNTDPESSGVFQQALSIFIEQGTEVLKFQLLNTSDQVLAEMDMSVVKELLRHEDGKVVSVTVSEKSFTMKQKHKNVLNPKVILTFAPESNDEEQALLHGLGASTETEWMLHQQLQKTQEAMGQQERKSGQKPQELSEIELLSQGCYGPLHMFGKLGAKNLVYVGVVGPPKRKKFALLIWDSEHDCQHEKPPRHEIELLHIASVAPDPARSEVFTVSHIEKDKVHQKAIFQRIDRGRDVWVEMLQLLVTKVHEEHDAKRKERKK